MRVALILSGSYWYAPYANIYEEILKSQSINYDIISWDRDGLNDDNIISFKVLSIQSYSRIRKLKDYIRYKSFVIKKIKKNNYDKLIVFGPQIGLLLYPFLSKYYNKRFFLDYRDLSIEQIFKRRFKKLVKSCSKIAISSPGFKRVLPIGFNYIICHNLSNGFFDSYSKAKNNITKPFIDSKISISTIGAIRDISSNMELMLSLKNIEDITIRFIGKGSENISQLAMDVANAEYIGMYKKEDEHKYIVASDFINIYYPDKITHSTALSNRFYNAILYKRPMIVKSNSIQGEYIEKYKLGLSLDNCVGLERKIHSYVKSFDYETFSKNCDLLHDLFLSDYKIFEVELFEFLKE